ncbi:hypothetical protein V2H45_12295 [Tumidithrix elongata RA019]|uniref:Uncharacterized protein n=1 Tax=Tumidithrix elongata BACA0141 TaxID=2716417 RepID=A0AAW9Q285_9CYAN|nr:hypothetical protein [Tumidithrix elongata RA019]
MTPRLAVMEAVEKLNYRVTVADVSAQSGLSLDIAQREVLTLATETGGNLQVAESGEIAYKFASNFRNILLSRSFKLRVQEWLKTVWKWLFYLIRISFGILLIVSILIVVLGIIAATIALQSQNRDDNDNRRSSDRSYNGGGGGFIFWGGGWWGNPFVVFDPYYYEPQQLRARDPNEMGFLESVFSFLFGDGNPNADLEERRWRAIAAVIRNHHGVVTAEQITPYLDNIGKVEEGYEDYMIPVLAKFNGYPQVSEQGTLVYSFPDLQKVASEKKQTRVGSYLLEDLWVFSKAGSGKVALSIGLGVFYFVGALILGSLLQNPRLAYQLTGFLGFVAAAYGFLLGYATLFLTVPLVRYFVLRGLNSQIEARNQMRLARKEQLSHPTPQLQEKLAFASQLSIAQEAIDENNLAYTTETDLNDQEYAKMLKEMENPPKS